MSCLEVRLPGYLFLVPGSTLDSQLRHQGKDHPGLPARLDQIRADLNARADGVAVTVDPARKPGDDPALLAYAPTYLLRLYLTKHGQGHTIAAIHPLRARDHQRLARGYLRVQASGWQLVLDPRGIRGEAPGHWQRLMAAWDRLTELTATPQTPTLSTRQRAFLDRLDHLVDASQQITRDAAKAERPYPYRQIIPTGGRRYGIQQSYDFHLVGSEVPDEGTFVQVRGEPEQRGQVTRVHAGVATVRFDQPVDWDRLDQHQQSALERTPSSVVFDAQRDAVAQLRSRQARNPHLLTALVEHRLRPVQRAVAEPTEPLDAGQLEAFRRALAVEDVLPVIGPPGTGKTRTISQIARACALTQGRVLVTAHSNRAVDNVLPRLSRDLVVIRVGNAGAVTPEGQPYLLERQAADLQAEIGARTGRVLRGYPQPELAWQWAGELDSRTDRLAAAAEAVRRAEADLAAARRAAGGPQAVLVDQLAAERERCRLAVQRHDLRVSRLSQRQQRRQSRAGSPLLGALFAAAARRTGRQLQAAWAEAAQLQNALDAATEHTAAAESALDLAVRDNTQVRAAAAAVRSGVQRRDECAVEAGTAAKRCRELVHLVAEPPGLPSSSDMVELIAALARLRDWLRQSLPLLASRAALLGEWQREVSVATEQLHPELIRYAHVVAATCIGAASRPELSEVDFELAIVDEAGQIDMGTVLVPLVRARRAVLVGDPQQLPPFLDSEVEAWGRGIDDPEIRRMLGRSALQLLLEGLPPDSGVMFTEQRRMPREIAEFLSAQFYQGRLRTTRTVAHRDPLFGRPLAFVDTTALPPEQRQEQSAASSERWGQRGYVNRKEANLLIELASWYEARGADWAVILPYQAQVAYVRAALNPRINDADRVRLNVGTVDSFQGGEREVILTGFTRSNTAGDVGFLKELRRTNVAFSRAKEQLVVVGDLSTLTASRDAGFRQLARALRSHLDRHGEIRQYADVRAQLARLSAPRDGR